MCRSASLAHDRSNLGFSKTLSSKSAVKSRYGTRTQESNNDRHPDDPYHGLWRLGPEGRWQTGVTEPAAQGVQVHGERAHPVSRPAPGLDLLREIDLARVAPQNKR